MKARASLVLLAALVLTSCQDLQRPTVPNVQQPHVPSADLGVVGFTATVIFDGAHGGNRHFFFLPPLAPLPSFSGVFDASFEPEVEICALTGTECVLPLVAGFRTASTGEEDDEDDNGAAKIQLDAEGERYSIDWDTSDLAGPFASASWSEARSWAL